MAQQKKRIFWIGFACICAKSRFCQGFTAKRNDAQKTQSMNYGSCSALQFLQKADRQSPLHEKGAAARISGVVRRLRPFCHRCPGASGRTPQKMHHACKAWCTVSTSGRFASSIPGFDIVSNPGIFYPPGKAAAPGIFPEALQYLFRLRRLRCDIAAARGIFSTARWRMAAAHLLCPANKSFYVLFVVS